MAYCTLQEAKDFGAIGADELIEAQIVVASRVIDDVTKTWFNQRSRIVEAIIGEDSHFRLEAPLIDFTGAMVDGRQILEDELTILTLNAEGNMIKGKLNRLLNKSDYYDEIKTLYITGVFGWELIPSQVGLACKLLTVHYCNSPISNSLPSGISGLSVEGYSISFKNNSGSLKDNIPNNIKSLLADYSNSWTGVW